MFALHLYNDDRIHSACVVLSNRNYKGMPIVDYLPTGETEKEQDITNYRYVLDENLDTGELSWEYEYDPLPEPEPSEPDAPAEEPSVWDELDAAYREGVNSV